MSRAHDVIRNGQTTAIIVCIEVKQAGEDSGNMAAAGRGGLREHGRRRARRTPGKGGRSEGSVTSCDREETMAAALRPLRRLQQVLLPRIGVTPVRAWSGGKGSPHTGVDKTLVSFPVKVSHFQQPGTGETKNGALRPMTSPLLEVGGSGGLSDREMQPGQNVSGGTAQSVQGTTHIEDYSSSSSDSSLDSSSDSENEEENRTVTDLHVNKGHSSGGLKDWLPSSQMSSSCLGHTSLEKESLEQNDRIGLSEENAEDMRDFAPAITAEEQSLRTSPLHSKMTLPAEDKVKSENWSALTEETSAMTDSEEIVLLSTFQELPSETVKTLAPESKTSSVLSSTTSVENPEKGEATLATESGKTWGPTSHERLATNKKAELQEPYLPPEPRAAPQEPFDNTKYQNLQHFTYTPFTFVDVDVELAKLRLPQPSSGRPSPRH